MADITITIPVSNVQYTIWLRTSYIGMSLVSDAGVPMVNITELGPDQVDALKDFLSEAIREVLKIFESRQGDVNGVPFEYDDINVIYRFNEATPLLPQAASLKSSLNEDVKNAIYVYVTYLWFQFKGNDKLASYMLGRYLKLTNNIDRNLYKLHD